MLLPNEKKQLALFFEICLGNDLTDWEYGYYQSIEKMHEAEGDEMHLTPRQWEIINRIVETYE